MKKWFISIFIIIFVTISFSQAQQPKSAKALWKSSQKYFNRHSYKKAIKDIDRLFKRYPKTRYKLSASILKGKSYINIRQYSKGIKLLDRLILKNKKLSNRADLMEYMGKAYKNWSVYSYAKKSINYYDKAIKLYLNKKQKDKAAQVYEQLAYVYRYKYYYKEYPRDYRKQYDARDKDVTRCYNQIYKLSTKRGVKVKALYNKAIYIRDQYYYNPKKKELALKAFKRIVKLFPKYSYGALAQWEIGNLHSRYSEFVPAIKEYKKFIKKYPDHAKVDQVKKAIDYIKAPLISLSVQSTAKPGDKTKLKWSIRNVKKVTLKAYKVELFDVLKEVEFLRNIDQYKNKNVKVAVSWKFKTPVKDKHLYHYSDGKSNPFIELPITKSGAYIIKGFGKNPEGKAYGVTTLVIVSKLGLIVKSGKDKTLVYTVNSLTGKPGEKVDILIQHLVKSSRVNKKYIYEFDYNDIKTGQSGLGTFRWKNTRKNYWSRNLVVLAKSGEDYAYAGSYYYYYWYGYRRNYKIYGYTDRPVYRPSQTVHFKQIVRKYVKGKYKNLEGKKVHVLITDPKGNKVFDKTLKSNDYGTVSDSFILGDKPPLGVYRIQTKVENETYSYWESLGNQFRVEEYKKPEYKVTISTKESTYKIGDKINFKIQAKYYFGSPVANGKVEYTIYKSQFYHYYRPYRKYGWFYNRNFYNRWASRGFGGYQPYYSHRRELVTRGKLKLDKNGLLYIPIKSKHFKKASHADVKYTVEAKVVDSSRREIRGYGEVKVTNKAFYIYLNPKRYLYEKSETVKIKVTSKNPNNQPVAFKGTLKVYPVKYISKKVNSKITHTETLGKAIISKKIFVTGRGEKTVKFKTDREGYFKVITKTKDDRGAEIIGTCYLWIAQKKSEFDHYRYKDIEIIIDKDTYVLGDVAKVLINTKHKNSYVLLTGEADDIYFEKVIFIKGKSKLIKIPITRSLSPNIWLTASTFNNNKLYKDSLEVIVPPEHNYLKVKVIAPKDTFKPGEEAEFTVLTKNYLGNGVKTELSIGFVDSSIYYIQGPFREDIRKFFYGRKRNLRVRTSTGFDYRHYGRGRKLGRRKSKEGFAGNRLAMEGGAAEDEEALADSKEIKSEMAKPTSSPKKKAKNGKSDRRDGFGKPDYKKAKVRKDFPDTMFWKAHVETNKDGVAKIKVKFPDTLTTWKIKSTAITKETEVGVYDLDIITRKNLIVRLQAPRFFQERDTVYISGIVHNYLDSDKTALVKLNVTDQIGIKQLIINGKSKKELRKLKQELQIEIRVPKNGEKRVDFVIKVKKKRQLAKGKKDLATVTISALTDEESDAMQLKFPVLEYGVEKFIAQNGILDVQRNKTNANLTFTIPKEIKPGTEEIKVILNPSIASVMIDALPYLISYPYGCVEQTMSRFLPTVVTQNTLSNMGISLEEIAQRNSKEFKYLKKSPIYSTSEMNKMVAQGLDRLYGFQHSDGGWGWWKNDRSNPYMSAYVVYGLYTASKSKVRVRQSVLDSGIRFIVNRLSSGEKINKYSWYRDDDNVKAYMLYVISLVKPKDMRRKKVKALLNDLWDKRDSLNEYSKILLALTQKQIGDQEKAETMLENLEDFIKVNEELETANFQDINKYWYWYENGIESSAFALRAYLKIKPNSRYIPMIVKWLVRSRKGRRWFSTKDTAFVVYSLAEFMKTTDELNPDLTVRVSLGDNFKRKFRVTRKNLIFNKPEFTIPSKELTSGKQKMTISISGKGKIYYSTFLKYFTKEKRIKGAGHEVYVKRRYFKLTPKEVRRYRKEYDYKKKKYVRVAYKDLTYTKKAIKFGAHLDSGDMIEVNLSIKANNNFEYLMFEDPKPAGCEPIALKSGSTYQGGFVSNMELRDTFVSFFVTYLNQGKYNIKYKIRAEIPGVFYIMPTQAQAMYSPYVRGISDSGKMNISEKQVE